MIAIERVHALEVDGEICLHVEACRGKSTARLHEHAAALLLFDLVAIFSKRGKLHEVFQRALAEEVETMKAALEIVHGKAAPV